jgi:hypothetical protein
MNLKLEEARKHIWGQPGENCRKGQRPKSVGHLRGITERQKPVSGWIMATVVGFRGPERATWVEKQWNGIIDRDASLV